MTQTERLDTTHQPEEVDPPVLPEAKHTGDRAMNIPGGVLSEQEFLDWAKSENFGNGKRGTYRNGSHFLYVKGCHQVASEEDALAALEVARDLTSRGALHPDTRWGVYKMDGYHQLFPVSPAIKALSLDEHHGTEIADKLKQDYGVEHSPAVIEWMQRVDPRYEPDQPVPLDSQLRFLNTHEASHLNNWGVDEDGTMYPVDAEVIHFPLHS